MWGVGMLWYHLWCFCIVFSVWGVRASFCGRCLAHSICHCTVHSHGRLGVPSALWFLFWKYHLMNRCVSSESLAVGDCFFAVSWMATVGGKILVCICWFYTQVGHYTSTSSFTVVAKKKIHFPWTIWLWTWLWGVLGWFLLWSCSDFPLHDSKNVSSMYHHHTAG